MLHKFDPKQLERLERPERRQLLDVEEIFSSIPLDAGQSVADLGSGTGYFALPLSRRLTAGKVYALDIADEMIEYLRHRVTEAGAANIEVIKCSGLDFPIPKGAMDGALVAFVLHEQDDQPGFLEKARALLKPGGWLSVVEWEKKETKMGPPVAERIGRDELKTLALRAGLEFVSAESTGDTVYVALLKRPEGQGAPKLVGADLVSDHRGLNEAP